MQDNVKDYVKIKEFVRSVLQQYPQQRQICHFFMHVCLYKTIADWSGMPSTTRVSEYNLDDFLAKFEQIVADPTKEAKKMISDKPTKPAPGAGKKMRSVKDQIVDVYRFLWTDLFSVVQSLIDASGTYSVTPLDNMKSMTTFCDSVRIRELFMDYTSCVFPALVLKDTNKVLVKGLSVRLDFHLDCWSYLHDFQLKRYLGVWHEIAFVKSWFENDTSLSNVTATYTAAISGPLGNVGGVINIDNFDSKNHAYGVGVPQPKPGTLAVAFSPFNFLNPLVDTKELTWSSLMFAIKTNYKIIYLGNETAQNNKPYTESIVVSDDNIWILSREPTMDRAHFEWLVEYARSYAVDTTKLIERPGAVL